MAGIGFVVTFGTLSGKLGLGPTKQAPLFFIYFVYSAVAVLIYVITQTILVLRVAVNRLWPLGSLYMAFSTFALAQVFIFVLSTNVCETTAHNFDGIFFASIFHLFSVMMVYKYWDSITEEDLEFSLGSKNDWTLHEPLMEEQRVPDHDNRCAEQYEKRY
jgi:predicted neutral ceramidase superfamily lipid hydrolase